jgi:hypothetical protein
MNPTITVKTRRSLPQGGIWRKEFAAMTKPGKAAKSASRNERLSAALRENLKRRKQQARARNHGVAEDFPDETVRQEDGLGAPGPDFRRNRGSE